MKLATLTEFKSYVFGLEANNYQIMASAGV
jgi:hypothetical protein